MLKVGVQSAGWYDRNDPDKSFAFIKGCGFEAVDFNIDHFLPVKELMKSDTIFPTFFDQSTEELLAYFTPMKEAAEKHGITFSQMHAPFPVWIKEKDELNDYVFEAVVKCLDICRFVDCPTIVVHPVGRTLKSVEWDTNMAIYRRLIPDAKRTGVKICLENMFIAYKGRIIESVCSDVKEACAYIDTLNAEAGAELFGFCLDIGHANIVGRNIKQYIQALGDRLTILHIHDNDGLGDLHGMPYTFTRNWGADLVCDWNGMVEGLREIGYKGVLNFETFRVICSNFPRPLWQKALELIAATGHYWAELIEAE